MENVVFVVHLIVALALILVILWQRTAQDGGGLMGGSSTMGGLFTARGSANLLTRTTAILATIFMCTSLILGVIASSRHQTHSLTETIPPMNPPAAADLPAAAKPAEPPPAPEAPQVPVSK